MTKGTPALPYAKELITANKKSGICRGILRKNDKKNREKSFGNYRSARVRMTK